MLRLATHRLNPLPWWVPTLAFGLVTAVMGGLIAHWQPPTPAVHDEFSYLLAGDTFASGRLSNPTHPHWEHFESFHIIHQPSYASKYPPAQGLFLALGQVVFGDPFAGVLIANGLAVAACYWVLLACVPRKWANVGGLVLLLHPGLQLAWGQTFWGGTIATLGGALVLGATLRLIRDPQASSAAAMALGALVLANSRPYEGAVACLICGGWLMIGWWRNRSPHAPREDSGRSPDGFTDIPTVTSIAAIRHAEREGYVAVPHAEREGYFGWQRLWLRVVVPQVLILSLGGAAMLAYNYRVTGDPLRLPYMVHEAKYGIAPLFLWQQPKSDHDYRYGRIRDYHHGWSMDWYRDQQSLEGLLSTKGRMTWAAVKFFFPLPVAAALVFAPWMRGRRIRPVVAVLCMGWAASMISVWSWPHYMAPLVAPLAVVVIVWSLRNAVVAGRRPRLGVSPVKLLVGLQAVAFIGSVISHLLDERDHWQHKRAEIIELLEQTPRKDLVFVRYQDDGNPHAEWVYNRANIDRAEVVWARELGPELDQALVDYFRDRVVWLLEPDTEPPRLTRRQPDAPRDTSKGGANWSVVTSLQSPARGKPQPRP